MKRPSHQRKKTPVRHLTFVELSAFIQLESRRLQKTYKTSRDFEKSVLGRTVKISEEVGELCDEILASFSLQRKEKLQDHVSKLGEEVADVLITTLLLAERMGVDVEEALALKIEKIHQRYQRR
ncbi:MAG: MazG nucleotide pyrophosphohydrolase domain-containing protein [Patescibacteria group bacterium]